MLYTLPSKGSQQTPLRGAVGSKLLHAFQAGECAAVVQISRVLGAIFLVVQIVLALDFMFAINEWLVDREGCHFMLISGSALLFLGGFAFAGLAYYYYAPAGGCGLNIFFITFTIILSLFVAALSVRIFSATWSACICRAQSKFHQCTQIPLPHFFVRHANLLKTETMANRTITCRRYI